MRHFRRTTVTALAALTIFAVTLTRVESANAAVPHWSAWEFCDVPRQADYIFRDYEIRTGWFFAASNPNLAYYYVTQWRMTGVGLPPPKVSRIVGFEYDATSVRRGSASASGFPAATSGTVYFAGGMPYERRGTWASAYTQLGDSKGFVICDQTTKAP